MLELYLIALACFAVLLKIVLIVGLVIIFVAPIVILWYIMQWAARLFLTFFR